MPHTHAQEVVSFDDFANDIIDEEQPPYKRSRRETSTTVDSFDSDSDRFMQATSYTPISSDIAEVDDFAMRNPPSNPPFDFNS